MTTIKVCGITNLKDALLAANLGANELGFNFCKASPRYIEPQAASQIVRRLPVTTRPVGVFVNETPERTLEIARIASLYAVQLHGEESPAIVEELKMAGSLVVIKCFRVSNDFDAAEAAAFGADAVLLDSFSVSQHGGTGETFDWSVAAKTAKMVDRLYLAGGLSPDNVADAVKAVGPWAVDACSRLESAPGIKDAEKVRRFISNVRGCG